MKQTIKYKLHKYMILPVVILVWILCVLPITIAYPFEKLADKFNDYIRNRTHRLMRKYDVGLYYNPTIKKDVLLARQDADILELNKICKG